MSDTLTRPEVTPTTDGDHEKFAHYVMGKPPRKAADILTEAMVLGTPVMALCGKVWVPSRDPQRYPICPECQQIKKDIQAAAGN